MDKCRICLKHQKKLRSLNDAEHGITFLDMLTYFVNIKIRAENGVTGYICSFCRKKLREAYDFKIKVERSESILNESDKLKRISFNNINDIKIQIEIDFDCKSLIQSVDNISEDLFKGGENSIAYNNTVIKKIKAEKEDNHKTQLTVKEFLNSVKMESDNDCDEQDYELNVEYDPGSDSNYKYSKPLKRRKKAAKEHKSKGIKCKGTEFIETKPIKPVYLEDVRLERTKSLAWSLPRKHRKRCVPKPDTGPSICPYCGKLFSKYALKNHILIHEGERAFKCDQCPKTFTLESILKNHKKIHTNTEKKFKCDVCIAAFSYKEALKSHLQFHSNERKFICDVCNKGFKRKCQLKRHKMIHSFGNKPMQCELCPSSFYQADGLRAHMRVHTGERPYKCEICSQPYSYKPDFNRHCLKKHGIFIKRRAIYVMNEEVLQRERALMRDLTLHAHGVIKGDELLKAFEGAKGAMAYEHAMKAIEAGQIPVNF